MATSVENRPAIYQSRYFSSVRKFMPKGDETPESIKVFLQNKLEKLHKIVADSKLPASCGSRQKASTVLVYDDAEIDEAASTAGFIELFEFYEEPCPTVGEALRNIDVNKNEWFVISAATPHGDPIIKNFVLSTVDLVQLTQLFVQDPTRPVREFLAYRTDNLRHSLVLASSKTF